MNAKRIISILVLLLFLSPQVSNLLHAFEHSDEFHCTEQTLQHLHEQDHNCDLCKVNLTKTVSGVYIVQLPACKFSEINILFSYQSFNFSHYSNSLYLRGPPCIG